MEKVRKNKGFTLVELIIVIVILGILAAVAVPAYSGYVSKAREANDMTILSSYATAAAAVASGSTADSVKTYKINVTTNGSTATVAVSFGTVSGGSFTATSDNTLNSNLQSQVKALANNESMTFTKQGAWVSKELIGGEEWTTTYGDSE